MAKGNAKKRYDSKKRLLKTGEIERSDGYYQFFYTDRKGKRHSVTAKSLTELREKEDELTKDRLDGLRDDGNNITLDEVFEIWRKLKRGLQDNTLQNYCYMYNQFVRPTIGSMQIKNMKRSDIRNFYNMLVDERNLKINTVDNIHSCLHQVIEVAVEDGYIRNNISDNALKELKQAHNFGRTHKRALTVTEQDLFIDFLKREDTVYHHWYPIFTTMINTGMRVGEVTGLTWDDIDWEEGIITVNRTLVYYNHANEQGCYFNVHEPKTEAGKRTIPMLEEVKEALLMEKAYQEYNKIKCVDTIDGVSDFIFLNRMGKVQHQGTLNKALRRIIRDCNDWQLDKDKNAKVLLPPFSCHSLRHTYTTRLVEAGVNLKVVQSVLGHADFSTTMDIYTTVTNELKQREFDSLQEKMNQRKNEKNSKNSDTE